MVAVAFALGKVKTDCIGCRHDATIAKQFGCHEPTPEPWAYVPCPACQGADADCVVCAGGQNGIEVRQCPAKLPRWCHESVANAFRYEAGILPRAGGWMDQDTLTARRLQVALVARGSMSKP